MPAQSPVPVLRSFSCKPPCFRGCWLTLHRLDIFPLPQRLLVQATSPKRKIAPRRQHTRGDFNMIRIKTGLRSILMLAACAAAPVIAASADPAKDFPNRPVRFIVPFAPGAGTDTTARVIAGKLAELWKQPVVAENRPSGAGV